MLNSFRSACFMLVVASCAWAQQEAVAPAAPVPSQIASAKKIFISNGGEETIFRLPKDVMYAGGPNRAYNELYAAMKAWGRYELVSTPGDADLVFAIGFIDRNEGPVFVSQFKLVISDSKTNIPLWSITRYIEPAGMTKNREKNYETAMNQLVDDVKGLASPVAAK